MPKKLSLMRRLLFAFAIILPFAAHAQRTISGTVTDSLTKEAVAFATVVAVNDPTLNTMTREDGSFTLTVSGNQVAVMAYGYAQKIITLEDGGKNKPLKVQLAPYGFMLEGVTISGKGKKPKYVRKNNPALEMAKQVIAHKNDNRLESKTAYKVETYEKMMMALDNFKFNFNRNKFIKQFQFIERYLDTSRLDTSRILTISLREQYGTEYFRQKPRSRKTVIDAKRMQGVDKVLDKEGLGSNLEAVFQPINIFNNDIDILTNTFVSPLSSTLATTFYHYYLTDTVEIDGHRCAELSFSPVNSESMGFVGRMYILLDSSYALAGFEMNVPYRINLNFVSRFQTAQRFEQLPDSTWAPKTCDTYATFYVFSKKRKRIYIHQNRSYGDYDFSISENDSVFATGGSRIYDDSAKVKRGNAYWEPKRMEPLTAAESVMDSLMVELRRIPKFASVIKTIEILVSNYVPTAKDMSNSYFDFGPIFNTISYNKLEGVRLRIGGMTTANLHPNLFFNGYVAFGCKDLKVKYKASLIYSFFKKDYHPFESLRNYISLTSEYDLQTPGYLYSIFDRDNILMSINMGNPLIRAQYVMRNTLQYEREWQNNLSVVALMRHERNTPAGELRYDKYLDANTLMAVRQFHTLGASLQLRYAPGERPFNNRMGRENVFNLTQGAPVLKVSHYFGYYFDTKFAQGGFVNKTEASAEMRIKMSAFGYIDGALYAGIVWNKAPWPMLFIPNSNQSILLQSNAFNTMLPMEFVADQYASLHLTYHLNGLILNRIPGIKRLKLREVASVSAMVGGLTHKNNPSFDPAGLYAFPDGMSAMGRVPFVEASVGIENIFKVLRIDYFFRCTHLNKPGVKKGGVRLTFRFTL